MQHDEADARELVKRVLEECDATVRTAGSFDEAIEVCKRLWAEETVTHRGEVFSFDEVVFEPSLEPESRHTERLVLIRAGAIRQGTRRFRDSPRDAPAPPIVNLASRAREAALVEQRTRERAHE